ncbi:MAG: S24/S26 family peptidase [Terriglobia bacterium]
MPPLLHVPQTKLAALRCKAKARGVLALRAFGGSMRPSVRPRDWLLVRRESALRILRGDLVAFMRQGRIYVHRVISKRGSGWTPVLLTRGDALPEPDLPVSAAELLGRVACVVRGPETINLEAGGRSVVERLISFLLRLRVIWGRTRIPVSDSARDLASSLPDVDTYR